MSPADPAIERLIDVRRFAEARRRLEQRFAEAPSDPDAHVQSARILVQEGNLDAASEHLAQALATDPRHLEARWLRHHLLVERRDYPGAERLLLELIGERPGDAQFIAGYAKVMLLAAETKKARALAEEALRLDPRSRDARLVATLVASVEDRREAAREHLADLVREYPDSLRVAYTLLNVLTQQGRHREAYGVAREILRHDPGDAEVVDLAIELRAATHWLAIPLWPFRRWGWAGSAGAWVGALVLMGLLRNAAPAAAITFAVAYAAFVVYSWVLPPTLRRWLRWRGLR